MKFSKRYEIQSRPTQPVQEWRPTFSYGTGRAWTYIGAGKVLGDAIANAEKMQHYHNQYRIYDLWKDRVVVP